MTLATAIMTAPNDKQKKRDDQAVKIDRRLAKFANLIAKNRRISAAELLSDLLEGPLMREWQKELKKLTQEGSEPFE